MTYKILRHDSGSYWLVFRDGKLFDTFLTRREARECAREWKALDALPNEFDAMVKSAEREWRTGTL